MKDKRIIILGCGHSGTTLLSGLMYFNGYRMLSVPTYHFECYFLNRLNEKILNENNNYFKKKNIRYYIEKLENHTRGKWVLKDPLLNYLIDDYDYVINNEYKILFIYREPGRVINHLFRELKEYMNEKSDDQILEMAKNQWIFSNKKILNFLNPTDKQYFIVNYNDLLHYKHIDSLELFLNQKINMNFVNKKLNKSENISIEDELINLYEKLEKEKSKAIKKIGVSQRDNNTYKPHKNLFHYALKKYQTKIKRKIFFKVNQNQPIYLRKPYPEL